jgi:hypothetical protein
MPLPLDKGNSVYGRQQHTSPEPLVAICKPRRQAIIGAREDKGQKTMNSIRQYRPAYFEGFENETVDFSTTYELINIPFVKNFAFGNFSHYAISDNCLMAIYDNGFEHWVVGFIKNPKSVKLPKWKGWKFRALLDGKEVVLSKEVVSSCGDVLTLRDGRKATNLRHARAEGNVVGGLQTATNRPSMPNLQPCR